MKLLGIDYGKKKTGLAIVDLDCKIPLPYSLIREKDEGKIIEKIHNICQKEKVDKIILGLPLDMEGRETKMSFLVRDFKAKAEKISGLKVELEPEVFTSQQASFNERALALRNKNPIKKTKKRLDSQSAALILESYLAKKHLS